MILNITIDMTQNCHIVGGELQIPLENQMVE